MRVRIALAAVTVAALAALVAVYRPDSAIRVATGMAAHTLCSETFVSGLAPADVFRETIAPFEGVKLIAAHLDVAVDRAQRSVRVAYRGHFANRAVYRDGLGCLLVEGRGPVDDGRPPAPQPAADPAFAGADVVAPHDPRLVAALDRLFADPPGQEPRRVKAVVVVKDGHVVAERYAPGVGPQTKLLGFSASKSVIHALVGILVGDGRLKVAAPAPVASWRAAGDPRGRITLDNLLRMTSGLAIAQTGSGFDPASRMLYLERDMAGYAESASLARTPGTRMDYSDASTLIVSRIVRDAAGGTGAAVQAFARRRLFDPLGMGAVVMEADATGTPIGSTHILATARDWARLGLLYADDGVANGKRILPAGWARYAATSTLGTSYGAGFWTNAGHDDDAQGRKDAGMPCDAFFASGNLGQRVYVMPAEKLVIVRLGVSHMEGFGIGHDLRFIRDVMAVYPSATRPSCSAR